MAFKRSGGSTPPGSTNQTTDIEILFSAPSSIAGRAAARKDNKARPGLPTRHLTFQAECVASSPIAQEANAMTLPRRRFLQLAAGAGALPAVARMAKAQTYP